MILGKLIVTGAIVFLMSYYYKKDTLKSIFWGVILILLGFEHHINRIIDILNK